LAPLSHALHHPQNRSSTLRPCQGRRPISRSIDARQVCHLSKDNSISIVTDLLPEWASYRIDRNGTRLPKTAPPPQGTYKASDGIGKTDYSDPRDFYAPTPVEQQLVWQALKPTRESYHVLTTTILRIEEMRCLSFGYNASWDEIRRKFVNWCFLEHGPDSLDMSDHDAEGRVVQVWGPSVIPGYSQISTDTRREPTQNDRVLGGKHSIYLFRNGQLAIDSHQHLPKLHRWYGLIEDFYFSPSWKPRVKDSTGVYMQNPDAFACRRCRLSRVLCYGHREHPNRTCGPCQMLKVKCSKEDGYGDEEVRVGNAVVPDPTRNPITLPQSDMMMVGDPRRLSASPSGYWKYPTGGLFGVFVEPKSSTMRSK